MASTWRPHQKEWTGIDMQRRTPSCQENQLVMKQQPTIVREVNARPWEFGRALELLRPRRKERAAQCGGDCEKAFTRTTPPTIRASPITAGTSSVCRNQNHPTKAIKTMPRPAHMA